MSELNSEVVICPSCKKDTTVNNADSALPVGTMLSNRYFIGIVLGQGGFGITYIGCDTRLNKKVAIKEYYPVNLVGRYSEYSTKLSVSSGENSEIFEHERQRFIKEAQLLAEFSGDRSVVDVTDIFSENNTAYMVMDYVEGENLDAYLRHSEKMDFDTAYEMLLPMLGSLSRMHAKGLIHRDISPANIMVQPDMHVILIDFGSAREYSIDGEKSLSVILKHGYSPVEQYQSKGLQGPWTDVYALSATIYKMITKITPPSSIDCMVGNVLKKPSELGATISKEEEKVLLKGLALSQADRYSSIQDLEEAFEKAREKSSLIKSSRKNPNKKHKAERVEKEKKSAKNLKEDEQIKYEATEIVDKKDIVEIPKASEKKTNRKILSFIGGLVLFAIVLVGSFYFSIRTSQNAANRANVNVVEKNDAEDILNTEIEESNVPIKEREIYSLTQAERDEVISQYPLYNSRVVDKTGLLAVSEKTKEYDPEVIESIKNDLDDFCEKTGVSLSVIILNNLNDIDGSLEEWTSKLLENDLYCGEKGGIVFALDVETLEWHVAYSEDLNDEVLQNKISGYINDDFISLVKDGDKTLSYRIKQYIAIAKCYVEFYLESLPPTEYVGSPLLVDDVGILSENQFEEIENMLEQYYVEKRVYLPILIVNQANKDSEGVASYFDKIFVQDTRIKGEFLLEISFNNTYMSWYLLKHGRGDAFSSYDEAKKILQGIVLDTYSSSGAYPAIIKYIELMEESINSKLPE